MSEVLSWVWKLLKTFIKLLFVYQIHKQYLEVLSGPPLQTCLEKYPKNTDDICLRQQPSIKMAEAHTCTLHTDSNLLGDYLSHLPRVHCRTRMNILKNVRRNNLLGILGQDELALWPAGKGRVLTGRRHIQPGVRHLGGVVVGLVRGGRGG